MVRGFRSVAVPANIVVSKIDVHDVKRASYATVDFTQTCLVKINDHNICGKIAQLLSNENPAFLYKVELY